MFTYITSPSFDHEAAVLQCFHFWFFIDGFFDGVKNESLKVVQQSAGDVPENELWNWPSATLEWSEVLLHFKAHLSPIFCCRVKWRFEQLVMMRSM